MRRIATLTTALVLSLGLAACAGEDASDDAANDAATPTSTEPTSTETAEGQVDRDVIDAVAEAAQATADEGTARFTVMVETEGTQAADGRAPVTAEGEEDFENERRLFTFSGPQGELRVIVAQSTAYIEMPATEDEQWVELELDRLSGGDFGFGGPGGLPFQSVGDNVTFLTESATRAEDAGDDDIDGESATRYELSVDLEEAAEDSADDAEPGLRRALSETGVRTLDVTVWVDDEGRIVRIEYALDLSQAEVDEGDVEADPTGRAIVTVDYRDFGQEVDVQVPSEDQIVEMDEDELREAFGDDSAGSDGTSGSDGDDGRDSDTASPSPTPSETATDDATEDATEEGSG